MPLTVRPRKDFNAFCLHLVLCAENPSLLGAESASATVRASICSANIYGVPTTGLAQPSAPGQERRVSAPLSLPLDECLPLICPCAMCQSQHPSSTFCLNPRCVSIISHNRLTASGTTILSILQMREPQQREGELSAQGHIVTQVCDRERVAQPRLEPRRLAPEPVHLGALLLLWRRESEGGDGQATPPGDRGSHRSRGTRTCAPSQKSANPKKVSLP